MPSTHQTAGRRGPGRQPAGPGWWRTHPPGSQRCLMQSQTGGRRRRRLPGWMMRCGTARPVPATRGSVCGREMLGRVNRGMRRHASGASSSDRGSSERQACSIHHARNRQPALGPRRCRTHLGQVAAPRCIDVAQSSGGGCMRLSVAGSLQQQGQEGRWRSAAWVGVTQSEMGRQQARRQAAPTTHPSTTRPSPTCAPVGPACATPAALLSTEPPRVGRASEAMLAAAAPLAVAAIRRVRVAAVAARPSGAEAWALVKPPTAAVSGVSRAVRACRAWR
jgi:hypothetical protein